jgi:predicted NUDIX family phosphoesterase
MLVGIIKAKRLKMLIKEIGDSKFKHFSDMKNRVNWINHNLQFLERNYELEHNLDYIQPIPYVIIENKGKIFGYRRSQKSGETRLRDLWSIGIGGHIDENETIERTIEREILEEIGLKVDYNRLQPIGLLYDNSKDVSAVHLGVVYKLRLTKKPEFILNSEIAEFDWFTETQLFAKNFENWSTLLIYNKAYKI